MPRQIKKSKTQSRDFPSDVPYLVALCRLAEEHPTKTISIPAQMLIDAVHQYEFVVVSQILEDVMDLIEKSKDVDE
jgi:hypothetical protein